MPVNRSVKKLIAPVLAGVAVAVATQIGAPPAGARDRAWPVCATTYEHGYPDAVPPILPPPRCSELPEIRRAEAQEAAAFAYHLPPTARYSDAEMNVFASEGYDGA